MKPFLLGPPDATSGVAPPALAAALAFPAPTTGRPLEPAGSTSPRASAPPPGFVCFTALVGLAVVRRRDAIHLRQGTLATRMGIHITKLSRFESGLGQSFAGHLEAACQALGCTPAAVLAEACQYQALLGDHGCQVVEHPGKVPAGYRSIESWELPSFLLGLAVEAYRPRAAPASNTSGAGA